MQRELRSRKSPNHDLACFLAEQYAEKYLKARMVEADVEFPKIHSPVILLDMALPLEPTWEVLRGDLGHLTAFAVLFRYPGATADEAKAADAARRCRRFRAAARAALGLT